jgi:hypothetical protein
LRVVKMAERIHLPFGVAGIGFQHARELGAPGVPIRFRQQHARIEKLVQQDRVARQVVRRPLRRGHQVGEPRQHGRMLDQEREVGAAPVHGLEETEQAIEHRLRIRAAFRCGGRGREQLRHERVDALPR